MYNTDTIVAAATPNGTAALAIIRISGRSCSDITESIVKEGEKFRSASPFQQKLFTIVNSDGEPIDEVLLTRYYAPKSFTGEDMVEITCHGGAVIVEEIIHATTLAGARYAGPGEFSRRAFLNGKVDLKKAEAIHRLIHAETSFSHKQAMSHYLGRDRLFFDNLRTDILDLLVSIETELEFSETDDIGTAEWFKNRVSEIRKRMINSFEIELKKRETLAEVEKGVTIALVGSTNAGKSSLFNMLLGYDRAIINSQAGTTRDIITESVKIRNHRVRFVDTAGIRETDDQIEREGIKRTKSVMNESALLLWVIDSTELLSMDEYAEIRGFRSVLALLNKADITSSNGNIEFLEKEGIKYIKTSAETREGAEDLIGEISDIIENRFSSADYDTVIGSEREEALIRKLLHETVEIDETLPLELLSESFRSLLHYLDDIYGIDSPEDLLNRVFGEFCIGK